jgi:predicted DNA-binding antitoxin AbrB/MazE fold protein
VIYRGRIKNGVVILDEAVSLPEGAEVRVELVQQESGAEAIKLIDQWLADDSGYDEQSWPELKTELERHRLSDRSLFGG